jgi:hypothetical protein
VVPKNAHPLICTLRRVYGGRQREEGEQRRVWVPDSGWIKAAGEGAGLYRGAGLPVVVSAGSQGGSETRAWSYDAPAVSSAAMTSECVWAPGGVLRP